MLAESSPSIVTPGQSMTVSGGEGCGIDPDATPQYVHIYLYAADTYLGYTFGDVGFANADTTWKRADLKVPDEARTGVVVGAYCTSNGPRGGVYYYPPAFAPAG